MHIRVDQDFLQADITDPCILGSDALASAGVTDSIAKRLTLLKDRRLCQPTSSGRVGAAWSSRTACPMQLWGAQSRRVQPATQPPDWVPLPVCCRGQRARPCHQVWRQRRHGPTHQTVAMRANVEAKMKEMTAARVICPSDSPWASDGEKERWLFRLLCGLQTAKRSH